MKYFNELMLEQLKRDRDEVTVVDNLHAYARILCRLQHIWNTISLIGEEKISREKMLEFFVGVASMAQHAAESLRLTEENKDEESVVLTKEAQIKELEKRFDDLLDFIASHAKNTAYIQHGNPRVSVEFNISEFKKVAGIS